MKKLLKTVLLVIALVIITCTYSYSQTSHRKKDAIIGGAIGAGTGAIVGHKKGKSAIIGGAVGAGAGYLHGRHKDKKGKS
jgi:hypothetical protein